ncbi:protein of unknown function [Aminobacter niigataensis]|nr:protein of unknown function [Aminobacter niigataensis]
MPHEYLRTWQGKGRDRSGTRIGELKLSLHRTYYPLPTNCSVIVASSVGVNIWPVPG